MVAPPSPGRAESGDRPGLRVQLRPGGGEGLPLARCAAARPWPREGRRGAAKPRPGQSRLPGPLSSQPWGRGLPSHPGGGGGADPGVRSEAGDAPVRWRPAARKLAFTFRALAECGAQTFRSISISPSWEAASLPTPQNLEPGVRAPHSLCRAQAPANLRLDPQLSPARPLAPRGLLAPRFPKSCARRTKLC